MKKCPFKHNNSSNKNNFRHQDLLKTHIQILTAQSVMLKQVETKKTSL